MVPHFKICLQKSTLSWHHVQVFLETWTKICGCLKTLAEVLALALEFRMSCQIYTFKHWKVRQGAKWAYVSCCEALLQRALLMKCKMSSCMCILKYESEVTDCTGHMLAAITDVPLTISFLMHVDLPGWRSSKSMWSQPVPNQYDPYWYYIRYSLENLSSTVIPLKLNLTLVLLDRH